MNTGKKNKINTDKLLEAIQILIKEEIKKNLPKLVKEVVKFEVKKAEKRILKETKKVTVTSSNTTPSKQTQLDEIEDPFDKAEAALNTHREQEKNFSKDPMINKMLNETASNYKPGQMAGGYDSTIPFETDERTISVNSSNVNSVAGRSSNGQGDLAQKLGYGEFSKASMIPSSTHSGRTVDINDPNTQPVIKALTRDYSELMKHMNKKK